MFPFLANAVSYTFSVFSLLCIKTAFQEERVVAALPLWVKIKEGLSWLWNQPLIRFMTILASGFNLITAGQVLLVIVLAQHLHATSFAIGLIFAVGGMGGIVGAAVAAPIQKRFSFGQIIIVTCWMTALLWPLYGIAPNIVVLGMITAAILFVFPIYDATQFSYRMALIPDELQGRVNSVFRLIAFAGQPLGVAFTGILLQTVKAIPAVLIISLGFIALALATMLNSHVRHARSLAEMHQMDRVT